MSQCGETRNSLSPKCFPWNQSFGNFISKKTLLSRNFCRVRANFLNFHSVYVQTKSIATLKWHIKQVNSWWSDTATFKNFFYEIERLQTFSLGQFATICLFVSPNRLQNFWPENSSLFATNFCLNIYFLGLILENTYLLKCHHVRSRSTEAHSEVHAEISSHPHVKFADQQIVKSRQKRQLWRIPQQTVMQPSEFEDLSHFNDDR